MSQTLLSVVALVFLLPIIWMVLSALQSHDVELARSAATVHVAGVEAGVRSLPPGWSSQAAQAARMEPVPRL